MGISVFQCALHMKCVFILSRAQSRVFPFSVVLIHHVHPYHSSQVIDEVQCTTCMILRTQPSYSTPAYIQIHYSVSGTVTLGSPGYGQGPLGPADIRSPTGPTRSPTRNMGEG